MGLLPQSLWGDNSFGILSSASHLGGLYHGWGGEGGISHPKLCAGAGERSRGPGEDSLQYFSLRILIQIQLFNSMWIGIRIKGAKPVQFHADPYWILV